MMLHPDDNRQSGAAMLSHKPTRVLSTQNRWAVILAGGDGTRLQPLTHLACGDNRPKQFCPLLGGESLLAYTRQRIAKAIHPDKVLFVLTKKHERFYEEELGRVPDSQKIVQAHNRGTLPAILWSLLRLIQADSAALVAFFPSDHYFANEDAFVSTVERTFDCAAQERDSVFLLGAGAERAETEYGWIEPENRVSGADQRDVSRVRRFWEKPPLEDARKLLGRGCLWNTFVMVGSVRAFLNMIQAVVPVLFAAFEAALNRELEYEEDRMRLLYDQIELSDFSRDILALSTERLFVTSCGEVGWSDLGEPRRFIAALTRKGSESLGSSGEACDKCGLTHQQMVTLCGDYESTSSSRELAAAQS